MSKNHNLLNNWLYKTIADNPQIVKDAKESIDVYRALNNIFIQDIQLAMKEMAKEILLIEKQ